MKKYLSFITFILLVTVTGNAQSTTSESGRTPTSESTVATKVKVFPNPATNVVNVLGLKNTPKADITIMDIYGNTVLTRQWAIRRNALNITISTLDSGAYIIHIRSTEQQVRTKFYKQ